MTHAACASILRTWHYLGPRRGLSLCIGCLHSTHHNSCNNVLSCAQPVCKLCTKALLKHLQVAHAASQRSTHDDTPAQEQEVHDASAGSTASASAWIDALDTSVSVPVLAPAGTTLSPPGLVEACSLAQAQLVQTPCARVAALYKAAQQLRCAEDAFVTLTRTDPGAKQDHVATNGAIVVWDMAAPQSAELICTAHSSLCCMEPGPRAAPHLVFAGSADGHMFCWQLPSKPVRAQLSAASPAIKFADASVATHHTLQQGLAHDSGLGPVQQVVAQPRSRQLPGGAVQFCVLTMTQWGLVSCFEITISSMQDGSAGAVPLPGNTCGTCSCRCGSCALSNQRCRDGHPAEECLCWCTPFQPWHHYVRLVQAQWSRWSSCRHAIPPAACSTACMGWHARWQSALIASCLAAHVESCAKGTCSAHLHLHRCSSCCPAVEDTLFLYAAYTSKCTRARSLHGYKWE